MENIKDIMVNKKNWAVIGVTEDKSKMGYKIWKRLKDNGYNVYGINAKYDEIDGEKIYSDIESLPEKIDVVDMVVNPRIGSKYLDSIKEAGIKYIWYQPGTYNDIIIKKTKEMGFEYIDDDCIYAILGE